ncbi:MAG: polymerase subunit gamma and tau [Myxococcaceae bacterium]|nr:polymerase subunit gamma and tau [Myxococcaceae bacterium]
MSKRAISHDFPTKLRALRALTALVLVAILMIARRSSAAPEAHILRIDPRAGVTDGQPVLTSVIELVQFNALSEVVTAKGCGAIRGDALLDCVSAAVEEKGALFKALPFPEGNTNLLVRVDAGENPAKFVSKTSWGAAGKDPLVGTAWLIALDASSAMGARYADAREVANQFIGALGPNDIAKLIIFDDRLNTYTAASQWVPAAQKATLVSILQTNNHTAPSSGGGRPFGGQVKGLTKAFADLGNTGSTVNIPMMQAMVLLSNGAGRQDAGSASVGADVMHQFFVKGRFPEDNTAAPKTPLPVISIFFPNVGGLVNQVSASNDLQFMEDISTPEIGGFFDIVKAGQGVAKAATILSLVKQRFNQMWVVKWRLACLAPTVEQSFRLLVRNVTPAVQPDASFQNVPIGVDPTSWPLDINIAQTKAEADANPVHPGGTFRVYGDFCWGGEKNRAEAYFVPAGTNPNQNVNRNDPEIAKKAMQNLIQQDMRGGAVESADQFVVLNVPDQDKILEGTGDNTVARVVIYDNKAKRASGVTAESVLTLKATKKPLNLPIILGAAGIVVVILLLVIVLLRGGGGGKGKRSNNNPPPAPVVAGGQGGGYGPPGGGYGPPGGGYGAASLREEPAAGPAYGAPPAAGPALAAPAFVPAPLPPAPLPPDPGGGAHPLASAGGAPVFQVRCPACHMLTMASPGQASICFSCGQPLPAGLPPASAASEPAAIAPAPAPPIAASAPAAALGEPLAFPLTGAMASPLEPPPNPYGATGASIIGASGQFAIRAGVDVRVGRDPAQCPITLSEPRISGVHATLKFENGHLLVRDEGSNNGTYVNGSRIAAGAFTPVPSGAQLRFGPVEFSVRLS